MTTGTIFSSIWPPETMMEPPGGRIKISAPTPRARLADSLSTPWLKPTSVRTIVTWMPMMRMPMSVRTGRCFRFSKTSLLVKLFVRDDQALREGRELSHFAARESGVAEHFVELGKGVRVASRGPQHLQAEHGVTSQRDAIFVRNELGRDGDSLRRQRGVYLAKHLFVGGRVEMVQKIRNQDDVVTGAEIHFERAAGDGRIAIRDAGLRGVFFGDFEHVGPVQAHHFRVRVVLGEGDAVQAMAGRDVQNFNW